MSKGIRTGLWMSEGGSRLELVIKDNVVTGTYATSHGRPGPEEVFPITGFVNDEIIGFVCSWGNYKSITSWSGRYTLHKDRECIKTVWHLARMYSDEQQTVPVDPLFNFLTYTGEYFWVE